MYLEIHTNIFRCTQTPGLIGRIYEQIVLSIIINGESCQIE